MQTGVIPSNLPSSAASLLVETRASSHSELQRNIQDIIKSIDNVPKVEEIRFTDIPAEYNKLWDIRKGLFPLVCYILNSIKMDSIYW